MTQAFEGMDPKEWWRTATLAEREGLTVRQYLERPVPVVVPSSLEVLNAELDAARREGFRVPRRELSAEDAWWRRESKRRQNLESFRMMTEVW